MSLRYNPETTIPKQDIHIEVPIRLRFRYHNCKGIIHDSHHFFKDPYMGRSHSHDRPPRAIGCKRTLHPPTYSVLEYNVVWRQDFTYTRGEIRYSCTEEVETWYTADFAVVRKGVMTGYIVGWCCSSSEKSSEIAVKRNMASSISQRSLVFGYA
jgi:hypothetical protein